MSHDFSPLNKGPLFGFGIIICLIVQYYTDPTSHISHTEVCIILPRNGKSIQVGIYSKDKCSRFVLF
jgi:hypothetical protein